MNENARVGELVQVMMQQRRCLHCEEPFTYRQSMGTLGCRRHRGEQQLAYSLVPYGMVGTWTCCGAAWNPRHSAWQGREAALGCTPIDHNDEAGLPLDETLSYKDAYDLFEDDLDRRNATRVPERHEVVIRRGAAAF